MELQTLVSHFWLRSTWRSLLFAVFSSTLKKVSLHLCLKHALFWKKLIFNFFPKSRFSKLVFHFFRTSDNVYSVLTVTNLKTSEFYMLWLYPKKMHHLWRKHEIFEKKSNLPFFDTIRNFRCFWVFVFQRLVFRIWYKPSREPSFTLFLAISRKKITSFGAITYLLKNRIGHFFI